MLHEKLSGDFKTRISKKLFQGLFVKKIAV